MSHDSVQRVSTQLRQASSLLLLGAQLLCINNSSQLRHALVQLALPVDHHVVKLVDVLRLVPAAGQQRQQHSVAGLSI